MSEICTVQEYLRSIRILTTLNGIPEGSTSWGDFILENGVVFDKIGDPDRYGRGIIKECFGNAGRLALHHKHLIYVEGYAMSIIPCQHAWVYDTLTGEIYDTTWREPGSSYIGLPIKDNYLRKHILKYKYWGLTDGLTRPGIMDEPVEEWKEEI